MKKKDLVFIIGLTIFMGVLWMAGFLIMGIWIPVRPVTHLRWLIFIIVTTLVISVWHSMIEDESDLVDKKQQKYIRKTNKRSSSRGKSSAKKSGSPKKKSSTAKNSSAGKKNNTKGKK